MAAQYHLIRSIWKAIRELNPGATAEESRRSVRVAIVGAREDEVSAIREYLLGPNPDPTEIIRSCESIAGFIAPLSDTQLADLCRADLVLASPNAVSHVPGARGTAFAFDPLSPDTSAKAILDSRLGRDLRLALASSFPGLRAEVARRMVREVSRENALFVIGTALGDVIPSVFTPLIGLAEAAGDTAFLTANQVRMLFLLGAAHGRPVGYAAQWREIGSIVGAAFGWRTIARNLVGKIPFGGGLVPKGAVAYAGTAVIGEGLIFLYTTGRRMTRKEVGDAFKRAYCDAVGSVKSLVGRGRGDESGSGSVPS